MFTITSKHTEGTEFKTLARKVGTDRLILAPDSAGPLLIEVFRLSGSSPVFRKELPEESNGIVAPTTGGGWTRPGQWNFSYVWTPSQIALESPPFSFRAPESYRIFYTHQSPVYGAVKTLHIVTIL